MKIKSQDYKLLVVRLTVGTVCVQRTVFGSFSVVTQVTLKFSGLKQQCYLPIVWARSLGRAQLGISPSKSIKKYQLGSLCGTQLGAGLA